MTRACEPPECQPVRRAEAGACPRDLTMAPVWFSYVLHNHGKNDYLQHGVMEMPS